MTEKELEEIDAMAKGATEGPYHLVRHFNGPVAKDGEGFFQICEFNRNMPNWVKDEQFYMQSRTYVPKLVAEVRRLRGFVHYVNDRMKFRKPGTTELVGPKELDELLDNWEPENKKNPSF
ncbi:MAG: hypothetical protein CMB99_15825 [Flavobacteriaceae bacterium]|jgi:hypothetical protein|nr:hypothetical protein [Flavobacteriaceae bacterium]|tara:strand:- start:6134 stop:6493 length:360 start_codon:yes stop_codon:yes gene_type:complete